MTTLINLPYELLTRVAWFADRRTLKALHLTCRALSRAATRELFGSVLIYPDEKSFEATKKVIEDVKLSILANKDPYDDEELEFPEILGHSIKQLSNFPSAHSAFLRFDSNCTGSYHSGPPQHSQFREDVFREFFSWLVTVKPRALGIWNLENENTSDESLSANITQVLSSLESLQLNIIRTRPKYTPDLQLSPYDSLYIFFRDLPEIWLTPTLSTLKHLTLYADHCFGFFPKLDLTNIHFPHLLTLSLGNYAFADDTQLDWILDHAPTLTELYLDQCPIIYDIGLYERNIRTDSFSFNKSELDFRNEPDNKYRKYYRAYDTRWHHYFDAFRTKLPHLQYVRIGNSDWDNGVPFDGAPRINVGLPANRYLAFYDGCGTNPYLFPGRPIHRGERVPPNCGEEDRDALRLLLGKLGMEVKETWEANDQNIVDLLDTDTSWR